MKSYEHIVAIGGLMIISLLIIGLLITINNKEPIKFNDNNIIDSLTNIIQQKNVICDSIKNDYKTWVIHTFDTEKHCLSDAQTIKNNPTTAVFAVNWSKRNFQWTHDWKHKKKDN